MATCNFFNGRRPAAAGAGAQEEEEREGAPGGSGCVTVCPAAPNCLVLYAASAAAVSATPVRCSPLLVCFAPAVWESGSCLQDHPTLLLLPSLPSLPSPSPLLLPLCTAFPFSRPMDLIHPTARRHSILLSAEEKKIKVEQEDKSELGKHLSRS